MRWYFNGNWLKTPSRLAGIRIFLGLKSIIPSLPPKNDTHLLTRSRGKVNDNNVKSVFLNDSCDGSGLNTGENSKDSHP